MVVDSHEMDGNCERQPQMTGNGWEAVYNHHETVQNGFETLSNVPKMGAKCHKMRVT